MSYTMNEALIRFSDKLESEGMNDQANQLRDLMKSFDKPQLTMEEIMAVKDTQKRQKLIHENMHLFGG